MDGIRYPPVIFLFLMRFAIAALVTWFFERLVEPKAALARQQDSSKIAVQTKTLNAQKIEAVRNGLDELKQRLEKSGQ